jgi:hypothetical protein
MDVMQKVLEMATITIAKDFSSTPGARHRSDGLYSGEDFRERLLEPHFKDPKATEEVTVVLDGTEGYASSFLEEAFGGLARIYGTEVCKERLVFVSTEDELLEDEILYYIEHPHGK